MTETAIDQESNIKTTSKNSNQIEDDKVESFTLGWVIRYILRYLYNIISYRLIKSKRVITNDKSSSNNKIDLHIEKVRRETKTTLSDVIHILYTNRQRYLESANLIEKPKSFSSFFSYLNKILHDPTSVVKIIAITLFIFLLHFIRPTITGNNDSNQILLQKENPQIVREYIVSKSEDNQRLIQTTFNYEQVKAIFNQNDYFENNNELIYVEEPSYMPPKPSLSRGLEIFRFSNLFTNLIDNDEYLQRILHKPDEEALAEDWRLVSRDLVVAIRRYGQSVKGTKST